MAKWEENDPDYIKYLATTANQIVTDFGEQRTIPDTRSIEKWHKQIYYPVAKEPQRVGRIRQISHRHPLLNSTVLVGTHSGTPAFNVPHAMTVFSEELRRQCQTLDDIWPTISNVERLRGVVRLVSWTHGEFVKIHPFCDGNGRMARLLSNCILVRYAIPYVLTVRPRPTGDYDICADASMLGDHSKMEMYLMREIVLSASSAPPATMN